MKKIKGFLNILARSCIFFTVAVFAFYLIGKMISNEKMVLTLSTLVLLFCFSVWFAFTNLFLKSKKINIVLRIFLHFISTVAGFVIFFIFIPGNSENASRAFIMTVAFSVLYIIIMTLLLIIRAIKRKNTKDKEEYTDVYSRSKEDII